MRIQVHGIAGIADLANDCAVIAGAVPVRGRGAVLASAEYGNKVAQGIARAAAGPHGSNYYKRMTAESLGSMVAEYGPEGPPKTDYVGVSGTAGAMRDLTKSAPRAAAHLQKRAGKLLDGLFWP
jgi:hypothetical protein